MSKLSRINLYILIMRDMDCVFPLHKEQNKTQLNSMISYKKNDLI